MGNVKISIFETAMENETALAAPTARLYIYKKGEVLKKKQQRSLFVTSATNYVKFQCTKAS